MLQVRATPVYQYPQDIYEAAPVSREDLRADRAKHQQGLGQEEREWAAANAEALKKNQVFLASVEKFWTLALCGAAADSEAKKPLLGFAHYLKLHVRLTKLLSPSFSGSHDASLRELARRDWTSDLERVGSADTSTEAGRMDWVTFVESLFELCDLWTVTPVSDETAPAAYAAFLDSCFERVTAPGVPPHGPEHAEQSADNEAGPADDKADASSESRAASPASSRRNASEPALVTWREANDVVSCIGAGASPLDGVLLLPAPQPTKAARTVKLPELEPKSAVAASEEPVTALAETDGQQRDTSSPPGAWGELEAASPEPQAKPTPPKKRSGRRTCRILRDKQLTKEERQKIEQARVMKQQTVDVVSADGATTTFDLRRMRATKYRDLASKEAADRGEPVETQQHDIQLDSVEVPAWVTQPEAWKHQMEVRSKLAEEWSDQKQARFKQFTDRFVDLRTRYINQLDAEITGRALAKRTFDTSWMGELRKPSSLDPAGWIALRPVSGAAATVFFLRQVLGLAAAWEAEPLSLLSTVEQGALLLHAVCRTTLCGRMLATALANRVQGPEFPELQCPVGTEQIAGLVLAVTQRIPGVEVAMAQGVDEAIARFPVVLDMLGNEQVSKMDGGNLVDALIKDVFSQVCELTGYGESTLDTTRTGGKPLILDPTSGDNGIKIVSSLTLSLPSAKHEVSVPNDVLYTVQRDALPAVVASTRLSTGAPKSRSAREHRSGLALPAHLCAPRYRSKLTTTLGISPRWYSQDEEPRRPTDEFLSPLRNGAGSPRARQFNRLPRQRGNSFIDMQPTSHVQRLPTYTAVPYGPRISSHIMQRSLLEENADVQRMLEQGGRGGYPRLPAANGTVAVEDSKPFSEMSEPGGESTANMAWVAATAKKGQRRVLEEARAAAVKGPPSWGVSTPNPNVKNVETQALAHNEGIQPTGVKWHVQTRNDRVIVASVLHSGVGF